MIPLHLPAGQADVLVFAQHIVGGVLYVTSDLTGSASTQMPNGVWAQYELAICQRGDETWAPDAISRLAARTLRDPLRPGETMGMDLLPGDSVISAFLFVDYGSFRLAHRSCGVLLCVGITAEEEAECFQSGSTVVLERLRGAGVFPFTDLERESFSDGAA
jgi:hypothetical protein